MAVPSAVKLLTEIWIGGWTCLLAAGFAAELTPWPALRVLRATGVYSSMLVASAGIVLFLTLVGLSSAGAEITIFAILACIIKYLVDTYHPGL